MTFNKIYIPNILISILSIFIFPLGVFLILKNETPKSIIYRIFLVLLLCIISFFVYFVLFNVFFNKQVSIDTNYINI